MDCRFRNLSDLSLEELMETKEDIEDIIAEREMSGESSVITCTAETVKLEEKPEKA